MNRLGYGENVHLVSMLEKLEENFAFVLSGEEDFWIGLKITDVSLLDREMFR